MRGGHPGNPNGRTTDVEATADDLIAEWDLRPDGEPLPGRQGLILPVRADNQSAVLKVSTPTDRNAHEHLALRHWNGSGAVRLLRADPRRRALLLERLTTDQSTIEDLTTQPDDVACRVVARLYGVLHRPALPQVMSTADLLRGWISELAGLPRGAPIPGRLVEQAIASGSALADDPGRVEVTLHGNLHYRNVLAARREPWLAIAPAPLRGDPHFDLAPMLWSRWEDMGGQARHVIRHRLFVLTDTAELDEDRARAWVLLRAVHRAFRLVHAGVPADSADLTRFVTVAKAVQD